MHPDGREDPVVAGHPVRQYVIDSGIFDDAGAAAHELERVPLPQEIGRRTERHRYRLAGLVAANLHRMREVDEKVTLRTLEPLLE